METEKTKDIKLIRDYIEQCGGEVAVADITVHSGAERLRVYPILQEMILDGSITIVKTEDLGAPAIVKLAD
ncbi:MAG: hypothetical protein IJ557_09460 [Bacteroidaceae bacterium]|nr:hypothetical protein [Bacteroidaceae bacterium]